MPRYKLPLLAVDDDESALAFYGVVLRHSDFSDYVPCTDSKHVMDSLASQSFSAVLLDLNMPPPSGEELLALIHDNHPDLPVLAMRRCQGNQSAAARLLGISQSTLSRRSRRRSPMQHA